MTETKKRDYEGLSGQETAESRQKHGSNRLPQRKRRSFWKRFLSNLGDPVIKILIGALAVNLFLTFRTEGDLFESVGIGLAVFLAATVSTLSEYQSEKAFSILSEESENGLCRVKRDGAVKEIRIADVVVGDLIFLSSGEGIPADGRLLSGKLLVDQSAMTGEGAEAEKKPSDRFTSDPSCESALFRGSINLSGKGEMVVTAVGADTFLGEISAEIQEDSRKSPLKMRLTKLAKQISVFGYIAAVAVFLVSLANVFLFDSGMRLEVILLKLSNPTYVISECIRALTLALTVLVMAVPEGLPVMIAVVLSSNMKKMVRDRVLVRKPVGLEAAGSMNLLFTDKTGTLTEGNMRLCKIATGDGRLLTPQVFSEEAGLPSLLFRLFCKYGCASVLGKDSKGRTVPIGGSATERALLSSVAKATFPDGYRTVSELPFDSSRKYSAVTLDGKKRLTLVLGAPEVLLPHVKRGLSKNGEPISADSGKWNRFFSACSERGERTLLLAVSEDPINAGSFTNRIPVSLSLVVGLSLIDPLRKEASQSVAKLQNAGIGVVMVTGDGKETAESVANSCGLLTADRNVVLSGSELSKMSDAKLTDLLPRIAVIARALPTDKSRLVRLAQEAGLVVGMTGDGINDAPALRKADVGFAMGSGTQVAKEAGDIVVLDDNLASIVKAVLYGRNVFKSIRKFITLQLTMNFCAVGVTVICPFLGIAAPVTVVQMLWINMIMDTLGGLAFAGEAPLPAIMKEPPKKREEAILNRYMVNEILLLGGFTVGLYLVFLKTPSITSRFRPDGNDLYLLTGFFALFIFSSVLNCFNARTDRLQFFAGLKKNKVFLAIMGAILAVQLFFVYFGGTVLRTAPLTEKELLTTLSFSFLVLPAEFLRKAVWKLRKKKGGY